MEPIEAIHPLHDAARALIEGLNREHQSIEALRGQVELQLEALHRHERETIEESTQSASQEVNTLQKLRTERDQIVRQVHLILGTDAPDVSLAKLIETLELELGDGNLVEELKALHTTLPTEAAATRERCRELAFSLQYALHFGHDLIEAIQRASAPPPVQVYTAEGSQKLPSSRRMMVNKIG
jgi:hypothetical protein